MDLEFFSAGIIFCLVYIVEIGFNVFVFWFIIKTIIQAAKRTKNQKYFKNNVVYYADVKGRGSKYATKYRDVSKDKLEMFKTDDINSLKDFFYDIFYRFEVAYNNLDYSTMKMLGTEQLYQNYYTGISLNLKAGKKRIIENIKRKNVIIYELDSTLIKQIASVMIEVSYYNYTLDKNGYVIAGDRNRPVVEKFEVQFRKDFEKKKQTNCPNCGASLTGNKCEYCRSTIKNTEFRISSIKRIIDKI